MWLAFEYITMKEIRLSAHFVSGLIGLFVCYTLSIYFFWESQITLSNFRIDPQHSRFAQFLYPFVGRESAKPIAIVIAFLSVHISWAYRFQAGFLLEVLLKKLSKKSKLSTSTIEQQDHDSLLHRDDVTLNESQLSKTLLHNSDSKKLPPK